MDEGAPIAGRKHEASLVDARGVVWFVIALALLTVVSAVAAYLLMGGFKTPHPVVSALPPQSTAPDAAAILQPAPAADLKSYRGEKRSELDSYGWVDRQAGVARIPIERAMELTAGRNSQGKRP